MDRLTKVAHVAQIIGSVAGVIAVVLMVWFRLSPQSGQAPVESAPQAGVVVNWVAPLILAACLLLAGAFHFAAAYITRTRNRTPEFPDVLRPALVGETSPTISIATPLDNEDVNRVRGYVGPPDIQPLSREVGPSVVIASPKNNERVGYRHAVRGSVAPPDTAVQLLVLDRNGLWHVQRKPVDVSGPAWSGECIFGDPDDPGGSYEIVAIRGGGLKERTYASLPTGAIQSNIVRVHRTLS